MQTEYAVLYLEINLISLALICIILKKTTGLSKMMAQRNFAMSIVAEMLFFISDTVYVLINSGIMPGGSIAKLICKELYFGATGVMCFFWFLYFEHLKDSAFIKDRKKIRLSASILFVLLFLLFINLFTGILFYVDDENVYHRGILFILCYILPYIYVFISCCQTIAGYKKKEGVIKRRTLWTMIIFPVAPGAAGIMQYIFPRMPFACGVLSLATLILYLDWIDQLISLDPLTGLNNRKQLNHFYEQWIRSHAEGEKLFLLLIDANKFKHINDTYGHIQGDIALKNIAEALKLGCRNLPRRANIARYGGDEFAVVFEAETKQDAENLKETINGYLKEVNERSGVPFELTVSIGIAMSGEKSTLKDLIDLADERMYSEKRRT